MKNIFIRLLTWLLVSFVLTIVAMGIWYVWFGASQSTESLKWLQFLQTIGTFLLPPIICAWFWTRGQEQNGFSWLKLDKGANRTTFVMAVVIMICAIPGINLLADINSKVELPESLSYLEQIFKEQEAAATALTERFLKADNIFGLIINICLMALLPALAEELTFRGTIQQSIYDGQIGDERKVHISIWVTAIIFSAIHMQFYGFIPRMLMGALFGYMLIWTGSLWVPIVMHFTNNGIAVVTYYLTNGLEEDGKNIADTFGAGDTWYLGVISLIVVAFLAYITSLGPQEFVRRIRKR